MPELGGRRVISLPATTIRAPQIAAAHERKIVHPCPMKFAVLCVGLLGGATLALLSGCGVLTEQVSVRDDAAPVVAARASIRPAAWSRREGSQPGIEVGYERFRADETRTLAAGETLNLGNQILAGPQTVAQSVTGQQAHVVYSHRFRFGSSFELEPFGGAARFDLRYQAQPAAAPLGSVLKESRTLAYGGITPRWRFNPWFALEARLAAGEAGRAQARSAELAMVLSPAPSVSLRLGYAERRQEFEFFSSGVWTQVDVRARGPSATVHLEF
jgi:hypothetical protein